MKNYKFIGLIIVFIYTFVACKESGLEDFSLTGNTRILVSADTKTNSITKTNETITISVSLALSNPANRAFEVALLVNQEAAKAKINKGNSENTFAIAPSAIQIDNVAKIAFGSDNATFKITVSRTEVEKYFGKNIAIGFTLDNASKGNEVDKNNDTGVIVLGTDELLTDGDIHYVSLQTGGEIIAVGDRINYSSTSGGITIPLTASLASFPGNAFSLTVGTNTDTIAQMIRENILPKNTIALPNDQFTLNKKLNFTSNSSEASFSVDIPWSTINENEDKFLAIVVEIKEPNLHLIDPTKNSTTILIDCNNILEEDVTNSGVFSVNRDNNDGPDSNEGSKKLIDNDHASKFLQADFTGDLEFTLEFEQPQKIGAYTFTSANDANQRDPKEWELLGSNDGEEWNVVDSRQNQVFENRLMTKRLNITYPVPYIYYLLTIKSIVGGTNLFQMAEWRMIKIH